MSLPLVTASGYIKAGRLMIRDRRSFDSAVSGLKDGWEVEVEITRLRATRSQKQNAYYWGVVIHPISEHTGYPPDDVHELLKAIFIPKPMAILKGNGDIVGQYVLGGSTRSMNTEEFSDFTERIKEWAATELDIYIPDPDEHGYGGGI